MRVTEKWLIQYQNRMSHQHSEPVHINKRSKTTQNTASRAFPPFEHPESWHELFMPMDSPHYQALAYLISHPEKYSAMAEHFEQCFVFHYCSIHHPDPFQMMFAVPNAGKRGLAGRGTIVSQGLKKGVLDIFLDWPTRHYHGLRIELKRTGETPRSVSQEQNEWIARYIETGYAAFACMGMASAIDKINAYLRGDCLY